MGWIMQVSRLGLGAAALLLSACGSLSGAKGDGPHKDETPRLKSSDLTGLGGADYAGALTYLDYGSGDLVTLDVRAGVTVKLNCLNIAIQYPDEPQANSTNEYCISEDGSSFAGAKLISLQRLGPNFLAFQTQETGEDDNKPALLRQSYILSRKAITSGREVSYDDGDTWIERNELDIERAK